MNIREEGIKRSLEKLGWIPPEQKDNIIDLSIIPKYWFVDEIRHDHTNIIYSIDIHEPKEWIAQIQHYKGGRLKIGSGKTAQEALINAVNQIDIDDGKERKNA